MLWKTTIRAAIAAAVIGLGAGPMAAQDNYPDHSIQWIIPFSAGSGADTFARTLITATEKVLGATIVPDNREGGGTAIGVAAAATQSPDGYTVFSQSDTLLLGLSSGTWPVTVDNIQAVARINADYKVLVVPAGSPFATYEDLVAYAKANPGGLRLGGVGSRSWSSFFVKKLTDKLGVTVTYVPYDGGSDVVSAVLGENLDAAVLTSSNVNPQVDSGDIRMLAQSLAARTEDRPDVPTFLELGHDDISDDVLWRGVFAPAGVPEEVLKKLSDALKQATEDPDWKAYMAKQRQIDAFMDYKEFDAYFRAQVAEYSKQ